MILRRVDRLSGGMQIKDFKGKIWTVAGIAQSRSSRRITVSVFDPEPGPAIEHDMFPDDMVEIVE